MKRLLNMAFAVMTVPAVNFAQSGLTASAFHLPPEGTGPSSCQFIALATGDKITLYGAGAQGHAPGDAMYVPAGKGQIETYKSKENKVFVGPAGHEVTKNDPAFESVVKAKKPECDTAMKRLNRAFKDRLPPAP